MDQMVRNYSCYVTTRRWPVVVFYNMVDVAAINAFTLWIENNSDYLESGSKFKSARREFLIALGMELVKPYIERRAENPRGFSNHVRKTIGEVLGRNIIDPVPELKKQKPSQYPGANCVDEAYQTAGCKEKKYNRANKAHYVCNLCSKRICGIHCKKEIKFTCNNCNDLLS